jgi:hypothetical protein
VRRPVAGNAEAHSTEPSAPSVAFADAIPVEITETVTVVVPGQNSKEEEGPAMPASGIVGIEPSVTTASSQMAAPESEAKAMADLSVQTGTAEAQMVDEPAAASTDVNAPAAIVSVDAVPVEVTVTVTVVVPGQTSEHIDEVEGTGFQPEQPISAPNLKRDEATAALDDGSRAAIGRQNLRPDWQTSARSPRAAFNLGSTCVHQPCELLGAQGRRT